MKLKIKGKPGEDLPPPPASPGPPPPLPPSVLSPRKIKYKTKTKAATENLSPDQSEITSKHHKQQHQRSSSYHDNDAQNYSASNTDNIDQIYSKDERDYETGSPIKRSHGYDNLNGNTEDQQEVYVNGYVAASPDSEGQSPTWAADQNGYDFPDGFSEDQKQAMAELQQLRLDLDYAGEKIFYVLWFVLKRNEN